MPRFPQRFAPLVFGIIQAAITTAVATAIATHQLTDFGIVFLERWAVAWSLAWLTMLPIVIVFAPVIQRGVAALTTPSAAGIEVEPVACGDPASATAPNRRPSVRDIENGHDFGPSQSSPARTMRIGRAAERNVPR